MPKWEVETDIIIHTTVRVTVEAEDRDGAMDAAMDILPTNINPGSARGWSAKVDLKAPKGVNVRAVKAHHFDTTSGAEKVRRVKEA